MFNHVWNENSKLLTCKNYQIEPNKKLKMAGRSVDMLQGNLIQGLGSDSLKTDLETRRKTA